MTDYKTINNTRYKIERVFDNSQTIEDIVVRNLMSKKGNLNLLTPASDARYNSIGGSMVVERMMQKYE